MMPPKTRAHVTVPFVGPDSLKGARMVGQYLASAKPRDEVGIIEGVATDRNAQQRTDGFKEAMDAAGVKSPPCIGRLESDSRQSAAAAMIAQHPQIRGLLCANDNRHRRRGCSAQRDRTGNVYITGYNNDAAITPLIATGGSSPRSTVSGAPGGVRRGHGAQSAQ